ncbi:MAG TPA: CDP-diacylglycerol--glycerol-3-phosphate 3-phosphatidyltransferase [Spirochaetia bacterium]|nr:MAG: CDP-diacylglycerol--glycerol-3-phosphate 3-phosphatidyltransferase [Spirochaetes bacterium GWB1_36_13]HCL57678.1 CDP-diacylglycerol--glycerol-3-phosphate 3-phosphatidyltransferase [Spirochaetia bacterium]
MNFKKHIPNSLTLFRIVLIIPINILIFGSYREKIVCLFLLGLSGLTDYLDGFFARKWNAVSDFGNFLDPLADKLVIISVLITFLQIDSTIFPYWMVWMIVTREFVITGLRISGIQGKEKVKTLFVGKLKTMAQFLTILLIILLLIIKDYLIERGVIPKIGGIIGVPFDRIWFNYFGGWAYFITYTPSFLLGISTILSVYSGIHYIIKNKRNILLQEEEDQDAE